MTADESEPRPLPQVASSRPMTAQAFNLALSEMGLPKTLIGMCIELVRILQPVSQ